MWCVPGNVAGNPSVRGTAPALASRNAQHRTCTQLTPAPGAAAGGLCRTHGLRIQLLVGERPALASETVSHIDCTSNSEGAMPDFS